MRIATLIRRNLAFYWRTNAAVIAGVALATAILCGALLLGRSVQTSLGNVVSQRLGRTQLVLASNNFFREQLGASFGPPFQAAPLLQIEALAIFEPNGRRAARVSVYGVDDRFAAFHQQADAAKPAGSRALLSPALARELEASGGGALLLRLDAPGRIPREFLQGRRDSTRTLRYTVADRVSPGALGEFSLIPRQGDVFAVYVSLPSLQKELGLVGQANVILLAGGSRSEADRILKEKFTLADLGLKLSAVEDGNALSLEHATTLVPDSLVDLASNTAPKLGHEVSQFSVYVANRIEHGEWNTPYSVIAAADSAGFSRLGVPPPANASEIVLTDWLAQDLDARQGDAVTLEYFVWDSSGTLRTDTANFKVSGIIPLRGLAADRNFTPEYPGITDSESLSDWDPPFPIELKRVRPKDEAYWKQYRTSPKAWVSMDTAHRLWGSRFGTVTSLRIQPANRQEQITAAIRGSLDPLSQGMLLNDVAAASKQAAQGTTDFGQYFLYFSFFLIVSALLLTALFFRLGVEQRLREIGTLRALGFSWAGVRRVFLMEGLVLAVTGIFLGTLLAALYTQALLLGLRTVWVGAVGTRLLELQWHWPSVLAGIGGALFISLVTLLFALRSIRELTPKSLLAGFAEKTESPVWLAGAASVFAMVLLGGTIAGRIPPEAGFFGAGALLLIAGLALISRLLRTRSVVLPSLPGARSLARLGLRNAGWRPGRSLLSIALIACATFLIVSLEAFQRTGEPAAGDRKSGTGGYGLIAESQAALLRDPNTTEGREELNLTALPQAHWEMFRLRPGEDISCLNLFQPQSPRILAARRTFLEQGRFRFAASLANSPELRANPWLLLDAPVADGALPAVVDQNSLKYVLHRQIGDIIELPGGVKLRIVATLADSLFQSELIISEKNFLQAFPDVQGYRVFLVDAPAEQAGQFEEALSDYGFDATGAGQRLASYHRVENTYIRIFQMLGLMGLTLGTFGLAAVLFRNALERREELGLLRALGYSRAQAKWLLLAENLSLLCCGALLGLVCAGLAVAPALEGGPWLSRLIGVALLLALIVGSGALASWLAARSALRVPLLESLRNE